MSSKKIYDGFYTVGVGENIESIAFLHGHFGSTIWNHPNNKELKKKRQDPDVLAAGDKLYIPALREKTATGGTNQLHRFKCKNTPSLFRFRPLVFGKPLANEKYSLVIDDDPPVEGVLDDSGKIERFVRPDARKAILTVGEGYSVFNYRIDLRTLVPEGEVRGIQMRLRQLGHYDGPLDGEASQATTNALAVFQERQGLEPTGVADDKTKELLLFQHGK